MMRDKRSIGHRPSDTVNRAQAMRDKALSVAMKRKEEFLGVRVPKDLRDKVTDRANDLGIPVSILIRNILEEAFKGREPVAYSSPNNEPQAVRPTEHFPSVLGWEILRLNKQVDCSSCGKQLLPGESVMLGLASGLVQPETTHIILCNQCQGFM